MYNKIKRLVKRILPQNFLVKNEFFLRKFLTPFYKGTKYECTICESKLSRFASLENSNNICPICGSLPRTRRLYQMLNEEFLHPNFTVLDFSPPRILYSKLKKRKNIHYFSTDFENEFFADYKFDIQHIEQPNQTFDLIICYHILEHIPNDLLAMKELYRVLKNEGKAIIQTPLKKGVIYENDEIVTPKDRLLHFGQDDHVRIYSISGLEQRLKEAGFITQVKNMTGNEYFGFSENEKTIICTKKQSENP